MNETTPKRLYAKIARIEDGRWCAVVAQDSRDGVTTILHVDADHNRRALECRIDQSMIMKPWETRQ